MQEHLRVWRSVVMVIVVVVGLSMAGTISAAEAASCSNTGVIPRDTNAQGNTYGEWSARWWQWVLSIPKVVNPNLDPTGADCTQGQDDAVWFLAGTFGGTATRTCTIPAGKPIFFPLINNVAFKPLGSETLLDLRQLAAGLIDTVSKLSCTIDGGAFSPDAALFDFRVKSPAFTVIAPSGALVSPGQLTVPGSTDHLVSDGYWLLLSPLSPGNHVLHFRAETTGGFSVDVTYTLIVQ